MKDKKEKILIILIIILIIAIVLIIAMILSVHNSSKPEVNSNNMYIGENNIITEDVFVNKIIDETSNEENLEGESQQVNSNLLIDESDDLYFLVKQFITAYYNIRSTDNALNIIDTEAKETLGINNENVMSLYTGMNNPEFCIDEIYSQQIDETKNLYLVYFRLIRNTVENSNIENQVLLIKTDIDNMTFSVYPYEYLANKNYSNLKEGDTVTINNVSPIENNSNNKFIFDNIDDEKTIIEFFKRYKFDLRYDMQHLYNCINEEYRNINFSTIDNFIQFANEKNLLEEEITQYQIQDNEDYIQYTAITNTSKSYIFNATTLLNYTILFDTYSTVLPEYLRIYNSSMPNVQAKYCIDRFFKGINDENYEFSYSKINSIQKNNYYPDLQSFENYVRENFYDTNLYDFDDYIIISPDVYQYTVIVTNANNNTESLTMTVTVTFLNDADFKIAFVIN